MASFLWGRDRRVPTVGYACPGWSGAGGGRVSALAAGVLVSPDSCAGSFAAVKPRSRRLLVTTKTEEKAIAAPASIGLSRPAAARGSAATL